MRIGEVESIIALAGDKTLTDEEVFYLIEMGSVAPNGKEHDKSDSIYHSYHVVLTDNVIYKTWAGDKHYGVLVTAYHTDGTDENYFMERTYEKSEDHGDHWMCEQIYHKLVPLVIHQRPIRDSGMTSYLVDGLNTITMSDNFKPLHVNDVNALVRFDKSKEDVEKYRREQKQMKEDIINGKVPAGDDRWDNLILGDEDTMYQVFEALRKAGHNIKLDGERDSFGWVTCGIVMDGELMTSEYF